MDIAISSIKESVVIEDQINQEKTLKWKEVWSLAALNAAVVISWIAYHEYQPVLMQKFGLSSLVNFLLTAKALVLVFVPPLAGLMADYLLKKSGRHFIVFTVGIGATAMIFMIVASIIGAGPLNEISAFLPYMLVLWLIAMNLFISPANSMIESFAPAHKLPLVMGVLILVTEFIYALEPLVIGLVHFFGETLTFVVGGILIAGTGYLFHRVSSDEVIQRKKELIKTTEKKNSGFMSLFTILIIGLVLGLAKAFLLEFLPNHVRTNFAQIGDYGNYMSFGLLGFSAVLAFLISGFVSKQKLSRVLMFGSGALAIGIVILLFSPNVSLLILGGMITAAAFSFINVSGLPFAINHLSVKHLTYGVGIYIGASEVANGLMEIYFQ